MGTWHGANRVHSQRFSVVDAILCTLTSLPSFVRQDGHARHLRVLDFSLRTSLSRRQPEPTMHLRTSGCKIASTKSERSAWASSTTSIRALQPARRPRHHFDDDGRGVLVT